MCLAACHYRGLAFAAKQITSPADCGLAESHGLLPHDAPEVPATNLKKKSRPERGGYVRENLASEAYLRRRMNRSPANPNTPSAIVDGSGTKVNPRKASMKKAAGGEPAAGTV